MSGWEQKKIQTGTECNVQIVLEGNVISLSLVHNRRQTTEFPKYRNFQRESFSLRFSLCHSKVNLYSILIRCVCVYSPIAHLKIQAAAACRFLFKHFPLQCLSIKEKLSGASSSSSSTVYLFVSVTTHNDTWQHIYIDTCKYSEHFHCHVALNQAT